MINLPFYYDYVLPNTVVPNASLPEASIIHFIQSQFSNKYRSENMFEINLDGKQESIFNTIFDYHFGIMPTSLRLGGSYLKSPCYNNLVNIQEDSVYYGKLKKQKYIYPIKVTLHFGRFTGVDLFGSKMNGEFFWKHISQEVLEDVRQKKALIFLDYANENFVHKHEYEALHVALERSDLPKEQIVLAMNSFNAQELYENWFTPEERRLEVRNLPFLLTNISHFYDRHQNVRIPNEEFLSSKQTIRKHHFLFPNRRGRPHRLAILTKMASDEILQLGNWSILENLPLDNYYFEAEKIFSINLYSTSKTLTSSFRNLEEETDKSFYDPCGWDHNGTYKPYQNSYFYIASETFVDLEYKSLTEKVFKPLANFQPFIFIAFPGALEELKKLGFKTFHPYIDESYDLESNYHLRMKMLYKEIYKLCKMSKEELHNWYWQMEEILLHNRNRLFNIFKYEINTIKFLKFLESKIL